ncbi:MAG: EAL domain-containing protein [Epsilonproteobacteria bacterium]|nr:EAL domain-containing protein [Campylobacterota bacterium]
MNFAKTNLSNKLLLFVIGAVVISILTVGLYVNEFLQESNYKSTLKRTQHAFERLLSELHKNDEKLRRGVRFIQTDEFLLASISLINNYQNPLHYNAILLDEEKKIIAKELLKRVKISLNHAIALYGHNEELISYVISTDLGYQMCFLSFIEAKQVTYCKYEHDDYYTLSNTQNELVPNVRHKSYYKSDEVKNGSKITYHYEDHELFTTAHQSLYESNNPSVIAHIKLTHRYPKSYYENLSKDLDLLLFVNDSYAEPGKALTIGEQPSLDNLAIINDKESYSSALKLQAQDKEIYFIITFGIESFTKNLNENRLQLLAVLGVILIAIALLFRLLFLRYLSRPMHALMTQIIKIQKGDYSPSPVLQSGDELETISQSIDLLAKAVDERENSLKLSQETLAYLSEHDSLTSLPNRRYFQLQLEHALELAKRNGTKVALLFIDLDVFKHVNDTLGHDIGDLLLINVARRLEGIMRSADTLARIGGDEFNVLIQDIKEVMTVEYIAKKILDDFNRPFICGEHTINATCSIGIAIFPDDGRDTVTLSKNADLAMYKAKEEGRDRYHFFSTDLSMYIQEKIKIIDALKSAINDFSEFYLLYQPKISLKENRVVSLEALIRWNSAELGFIPPDRFIPIAEETNLILPIGAWVLEKACSDFVKMQSLGIRLDKISINVSNVQIKHSNMIHTLKEVIHKTKIEPRYIELEITESYTATNDKHEFDTLIEFRYMNIGLAIDDFGTGYSSLSYLQRLPVTRLKIDKSFVENLPGSSESAAIAKAIIAMAKAFGLAITAEGVEREDQLEFLRAENCDEIQGYYFSKPLRLEQVVTFCEDFRHNATEHRP